MNDKENYLRITEIIKPFTGIEFIPDTILVPASNRGTLVHELIEHRLEGFESPIDDTMLIPYINSFDAFWDANKAIYEDGIVTLEKRLYCDDLKITGQIDFMLETEGRTYLIDWKSSNSVQKASWSLQGAAYRYLAEKSGFKDVDNTLFVKLDKKGLKPSLHKWENHQENLDIFFKCLELYKFFDMKNSRSGWNKG